ncbi:hypothetical protein HWV62_41507 [Athelia sp. TMB]|nr:hypothetical protein HWV62_41507 [Athelia sp. TMB]
MFVPSQDFPVEDARYYLDHTLRVQIDEEAGPVITQSGITAWTKFVLPFTPSRCLALSPFDKIFPIVASIITAMIVDPDGINQTQGASVLPSIRSAALPPLWPSIWTWLQIFHKNKQAAISLSGPPKVSAGLSHRRHAIIRDTLVYLTENDAAALPVAGKFREDVLALAATIWIEEAEDSNGICGFRAALLLRTSELPLAPRVTLEIMDRIIVACGGKTDTVLQLLCNRIRNNMNQLKPDVESLHLDFNCVLHHTQNSFAFPAGPDTLRRAFLADTSASIRLMADMMAQLRLSKAELFANIAARLGMMQIPFLLIIDSLRGPQAYQGLSTVFSTQFLHLVAWMTPHVPGVGAGIAHQVFAHFLRYTVPRFAAHRDLFVAMKRNVREAFPKASMPVGPIADSVEEFRARLSQWTEMNRDYQSGRLDVKVICGNPHTRPSREIHGVLFAEPVGLSGPNLRFLAHAIARDAVSVARSGSRPVTQGSDVPLIMLNYDDESGMRVKGGIVELRKALPGYPAVWVPYYCTPPGTMSLVSVVACLARGTVENPRDSQALAALLMITQANRGSERREVLKMCLTIIAQRNHISDCQRVAVIVKKMFPADT